MFVASHVLKIGSDFMFVSCVAGLSRKHRKDLKVGIIWDLKFMLHINIVLWRYLKNLKNTAHINIDN